MAHYSAKSEWPSHPKSFWRDTLDYARRHKWSLDTASSHSWGTIKCPSGECKVLVFSTGAGGENVAKTTRRKIERCGHGEGALDALADIQDRLTKAERLVDAAQALLAKNRAEIAAEMLDSVDSLLDEEAVWGEFQELVDAVEAHERDALTAFADASEPPSSSPVALRKASSHVGDARKDLKKQRSTLRQVKDLKTQANVLRERIEATDVE